MQGIKSVNNLLSVLSLDEKFINKVAEEKTTHYRPKDHRRTMPDGFVKVRRIDHPDFSIRHIQRVINSKLLAEECVALTPEMTGGIKERSPKNNARPHLGAEAILSIDISNCFPGISSSMIYGVYRETLLYTPPVAKLLTRLTSFGDRLPQGSPASSSLCNLYFKELVREIMLITKPRKIVFTQYIDDFTFSGTKENLQSVTEILIKLIKSYGLKVNERKLSLKEGSQRLSVTGYVVNNHELSVGRKYLRKVEREIIHLKDEKDLQRVKGKINYIKQTSNKKSATLRKKLNLRLQKIRETKD